LLCISGFFPHSPVFLQQVRVQKKASYATTVDALTTWRIAATTLTIVATSATNLIVPAASYTSSASAADVDRSPNNATETETAATAVMKTIAQHVRESPTFCAPMRNVSENACVAIVRMTAVTEATN
jgi:hypothetical protein